MMGLAFKTGTQHLNITKLWNKVWSVTPYTLLLLLNSAFFITVKTKCG